LQAVFF